MATVLLPSPRPSSKSPKKRPEEASGDLEKPSSPRKKLFSDPSDHLEEISRKFLDLPREPSPEIVEISTKSLAAKAKSKKQTAVVKRLFTKPAVATNEVKPETHEEPQNLPRESSPDFIEIVSESTTARTKSCKQNITRRVQSTLLGVFVTPTRNASSKTGDGASSSSGKSFQLETVQVTVIKDSSDDEASLKAPLNASHHMTTPDATEKSKNKPKGRTRGIQELFGVRKSSRHAGKAEKEKQEADLRQLILDGVEDPRIEIKIFPMKGRGLVAKEDFQPGEFVVEYNGQLITDYSDAKKQEAFYAKHPDKYGCYMYFFKHGTKTLCVDATAETGRYGRLLNHSRKTPNLRTEVIEIHGKPYLILRAARLIQAGEELLYDYGDRTPASLASFPWLKD